MRGFAAIGCLASTAGLVVLAGAIDSEGKDPLHGVSGSDTYRTYCSSCHGQEGKGNGPLADSLRFYPPDLTGLAMRNDGKFQVDLVARIVDGRDPVEGHGGPDMPVWGDAFKNAGTGYDDEGVKDKIRAVVLHLKCS